MRLRRFGGKELSVTNTPKSSSQSQVRQSWRKSALATVILAAVMLLLFAAKFSAAAPQFILSAPLPPDMLFNFAGWLGGVPWVFNLIHSLPFGLDLFAKYVLFAVVFGVYLGFWLILGTFYPRLARLWNYWATDAAYGLFGVLLTGFVLLPIQPLGLGIFGLSPNNFQYPPLPSIAWALALSLLFAASLHLVFRTKQVVYNDKRRQSLRLFVGAVGLIGFASVFGRLLLGTVSRAQTAVSNIYQRIRGLSPELTPTADHYVVSKNVFSPSVPARNWQLRISGLVNNNLSFTLDDLKALPAVERSSALICISNPVGGDLIGNSVWTGVKLKDLLNLAGVRPEANELILRAADNYSDSFPLDAALQEGTIVAYLQNGEPLTRDHGFPARVLVPGIYGMKNVKWVREIELSNQDYKGYWQARGWSDSAIIRTMSRIDTATATRLEDGSVAIGGIAYAGLRGVQRVEISVDNGLSWQDAQLKPARNELSWNLWAFNWQAEPGNYNVLVRATDGGGATQSAEQRRPLPDGATGYHKLKVRVI